MCNKCRNFKFFLLWVLSKKSLPKDIRILIMDKYLSCYYTGNDEHENEQFAWLGLFNLNDREWHSCIVTKPFNPVFVSNKRYGIECGYDFHTCIYGMSGYENN